MADLDAEFFALAGEDSSDVEDTKSTTNQHKSASPPPSAERSQSRSGETTANRPAMSQNPSIKVNGDAPKGLRKGRGRDSEEEGEAYVQSSLHHRLIANL